MSIYGDILDGYSGWKLTIKSINDKSQIELRKTFDNGSSVLVIVGRGYTYKHYKPNIKWSSTNDYDIHFALNGALQLTVETFNEINAVISRALFEMKK